MIAVRNFISSKPISVSIEHLFIHIQLNHQTITTNSVYISNQSDEKLFNDYFKCVNLIFSKYPNAIFILLGDFNLPSSKL